MKDGYYPSGKRRKPEDIKDDNHKMKVVKYFLPQLTHIVVAMEQQNDKTKKQ